jgi:hypothetical protein
MRRRASSVYMVGTTKMVSKRTQTTCRPRSPSQSDMRVSAPAPSASASGRAPSTMAPVVIRMGRNRKVADCLHQRIQRLHAMFAQLVGKFHDQECRVS